MASGFTKMACGVLETKPQGQRPNQCRDNCPEHMLRLELEMQVKKLQQQLNTKEEEDENSPPACIICLEKFGENRKRVMLAPCGHK